MTPEQVKGLARATLSDALTQLAIHFPDDLEPLGLSVPRALEHALQLAEEAIGLAPDLPDGHTALARLLLCHDDAEALADAVEVLQHALHLDSDHDPAEVAMAVALQRQGDLQAALSRVERVIHRGNGQPQSLALRALLLLDAGRVDEARRDLERAVRVAPRSGLLRLDAARALDATGDVEAANQQREAARDLLGRAFEIARQALDETG